MVLQILLGKIAPELCRSGRREDSFFLVRCADRCKFARCATIQSYTMA
ncbi:hypothetical protein X975_00941, partial [Stegodyphus mimosarum]